MPGEIPKYTQIALERDLDNNRFNSWLDHFHERLSHHETKGYPIVVGSEEVPYLRRALYTGIFAIRQEISDPSSETIDSSTQIQD